LAAFEIYLVVLLAITSLLFLPLWWWWWWWWYRQMVQRHSLMKYAYLMEFLYTNAPDVAEEVRANYIETMGKTILNLFRLYHASLQKLVLEVRREGGNVGAECFTFNY